jgi:hypothetical protein
LIIGVQHKLVSVTSSPFRLRGVYEKRRGG